MGSSSYDVQEGVATADVQWVQVLAYAMQGETDYARAAQRAERIRKRLRWEPGFLNGPELKPLGVHWRTYERLVIDHDRWVAMCIGCVATRLELNRRQLEDLDTGNLP